MHGFLKIVLDMGKLASHHFVEQRDLAAVRELLDVLDGLGIAHHIAHGNARHAQLVGDAADHEQVLVLLRKVHEAFPAQGKADVRLVHHNPIAGIQVALQRLLGEHARAGEAGVRQHRRIEAAAVVERRLRLYRRKRVRVHELQRVVAHVGNRQEVAGGGRRGNTHVAGTVRLRNGTDKRGNAGSRHEAFVGDLEIAAHHPAKMVPLAIGKERQVAFRDCLCDGALDALGRAKRVGNAREVDPVDLGPDVIGQRGFARGGNRRLVHGVRYDFKGLHFGALRSFQ